MSPAPHNTHAHTAHTRTHTRTHKDPDGHTRTHTDTRAHTDTHGRTHGRTPHTPAHSHARARTRAAPARSAHAHAQRPCAHTPSLARTHADSLTHTPSHPHTTATQLHTTPHKPTHNEITPNLPCTQGWFFQCGFHNTQIKALVRSSSALGRTRSHCATTVIANNEQQGSEKAPCHPVHGRGLTQGTAHGCREIAWQCSCRVARAMRFLKSVLWPCVVEMHLAVGSARYSLTQAQAHRHRISKWPCVLKLVFALSVCRFVGCEACVYTTHSRCLLISLHFTQRGLAFE